MGFTHTQVAILMTRPRKVRALFVPTGQEDQGRFAVALSQCGVQNVVFVDDRVCCDSTGTPASSTRSQNPPSVLPTQPSLTASDFHFQDSLNSSFATKVRAVRGPRRAVAAAAGEGGRQVLPVLRASRARLRRGGATAAHGRRRPTRAARRARRGPPLARPRDLAPAGWEKRAGVFFFF